MNKTQKSLPLQILNFNGGPDNKQDKWMKAQYAKNQGILYNYVG